MERPGPDRPRFLRRIWVLLIDAARIGLGLTLMLSAASKMYYPQLFLSNVVDYQIAGFHLSLVASLLIPWFEMACGLCLLGGICVRGALAISAALFLVFSIGQYATLLRGLRIQCGCFSTSGSLVSKWTLLRAAGLCGLAGLLLLAELLNRRMMALLSKSDA